MKMLSFQIQFSSSDSPEARNCSLDQLLRTITDSISEPAESPVVDVGDDYANVSVAIAQSLIDFWNVARPKLSVQKMKLIVVAQGEHGWDDYLLLYHFDSGQPLDDLLPENG